MQKNNRTIIVIGLLLVCFGGFLHSLMYSPYMVDDAYITFRYAENLSNGHGLSYNIPKQLEGYSNPLLLLLLSSGIKAGISPPLLAQLIGVISFLSLIILCFLCDERINGSSKFAIIPPLLIASCAACAYWSVAGLETLLHTLLLTVCVYFAIQKTPTIKNAKYQTILFTVALILLIISRTEGALLAIVIALIHSFNNHQYNNDNEKLCHNNEKSENDNEKLCHNRDKSKWSKLSAFAIPLTVIIVAIIFHGLRLLWFGTLSSGPAIAKLAGSIAPLSEGLHYSYSFVKDFLPSLFIMTIVFSVAVWGPVSPYLITIAICQFAIVLFIGGDWMVFYRMYIPVLPLISLEISRLIKYLIELNSKLKYPALALLLISVLKLMTIPIATKQEIIRYKAKNDLMTEISKDLRKTYKKHCSLAIGDIGVIGYKTNYTIIDMKGLVSPWICDSYKIIKEKNYLRTTLDTNLIFDKEPDLMLIAIEPANLTKSKIPTKKINLTKVKGFWSCDMSLLDNDRLVKQYILMKQYKGKKPLFLDYLLFQKRTKHLATSNPDKLLMEENKNEQI